MKFKPLLAPNDDPLRNPKFFEMLKYPLLASPKLDGIRCNVTEEGCMSRTMKKLPNRHIQEMFKDFMYLDGELVAGDPTDPLCYNKTQSIVMSLDKDASDVKFHVFDINHMLYAKRAFEERLYMVEQLLCDYSSENLIAVRHEAITSEAELTEYENVVLSRGYEGVMLRDMYGEYKHGRSTMRQGHLIKLKRFLDSEAILLDILEEQTNNNPSFINEVGQTSRSTAKGGMTGSGKAGKIIGSVLTGDFVGLEIEVSLGVMKHEERQLIWENRKEVIESTKAFTFRHFMHGVKDKPRFPRFVGWRDMGYM
jgi:DNA ligase-1